MRAALDGVVVLEWSTGVAGPDAGQLLGGLGAEVIKVEEKGRGDPFRAIKKVGGLIPVAGPGGRNLFFEPFNCNKKSLAIDLKHPAARQVICRLVEGCDVFLTNFRRGAAARLGLDYPELRKHNPRLVYARVSGFGAQGPDADSPAYDLAGQARSGAMTAMRHAEEVPFATWGIADEMAAMCAAYGIVTALLVRERQGVGQEVEASLLGGMLHLMRIQLSVKLLTGEEFAPYDRRRVGNPLLNIYRAGDGQWLCLAMGSLADKYWPRLCRALGLEHLEGDPRFSTMAAREANREELIALLDQVFTRRPRDAWVEYLKGWDIIAAGVSTLSEVASDPQTVANQYVQEYDHPVLGRIKLVGPPVQFSHSPARVLSPAPEVGQHSAEVLHKLGGYSENEITRLRELGVV
ncbi:MAG: CoA transferase [Chloroflexota bacterium]